MKVNGHPAHIILTSEVPSGNEREEALHLFRILSGDLNGTTYDHLYRIMCQFDNGEIDYNGEDTNEPENDD